MEEEIEEMMYCHECRTHYLVRALGRSEKCKCVKNNMEKKYVNREERENEFISKDQSNNAED